MPRQKSSNTTDRVPLSLEVTTVDDDSANQLECLKEISSKLSSLLSKVDVLNHNFEDWKDQTVTNDTVVPQENINPTLVQLTEVLERFTTTTTNQTIPAINTEATDLFLEQEARKLKSQLSTVWDVNLQARRQAYWQSFRNKNIADKYDEWRKAEAIILPQHVQMKLIKNEPQNQQKRRERQVIDNLDAEIELLELRADSHVLKYKDCDTNMKDEITNKATGQLRAFTLKLWDEDCRRNEDISKKRWTSRNAPWLIKYEENFKITHANTNPYFKEGETPEPPRTYAQAASDNRPPIRQTAANFRNTNERQTAYPTRQNQRKENNQYRENTRRGQSGDRRYTLAPRNVSEEDRYQYRRGQQPYQDYTDRNQTSTQRFTFSPRNNLQEGGSRYQPRERQDEQRMRPYNQEDTFRRNQRYNESNNYDNRQDFLGQDGRRNFRP